MLPSPHSLLAFIAVTIAVALGAFGLTGASRGILTTIPVDTWRSGVPFDERADWNPFANPDFARRFRILTARPNLEAMIPDTAAIAGIAIDLPAEAPKP